MNKNKLLRNMIEDESTLIAPGCHDSLGAKLIEMAGFELAMVSGYGVSASFLGKPDIGLVTMTEMVNITKHISSAVDIPIICDADTGYGNINNVFRTVREFEQAGASGLIIEDQITPKKCGLKSKIELISPKEHVEKIKSSLLARQDNDFLIIARTDANSVFGIEEAVRRGKIYAEAGADVIFIEGIKSIDQAREVASSLKEIPLLYNMLEKGKYYYTDNKELENLGFKIICYPIVTTRLYSQEIIKFLIDLKQTGTSERYLDKLMSMEDMDNLLNMKEYENREHEILNY